MHPHSIPPIFVTFDVSSGARSIDAKELQQENISRMFVTFDVSRPLKSIEAIELRENIKLIFVT